MVQCTKCGDPVLGDENSLCGSCAEEIAVEGEEEIMLNQ